MKSSFAIFKIGTLLIMTLFIIGPVQASAKSIINKNWRKVAIKGYDPVAYFTLGKPVKGIKEFEYKWRDAVWRFKNENHLNLFISDPEKYAPQYGGY